MNNINYTKIYGIIGKILCGTAGAIVGFLLGNVYLIIPGFGLGVLAGYLLEKAVLNPTKA